MIVSDTDKQWGLTVNSVGTQSIQPNERYPTQDHPTRYLFSPQKGRILNEYQLLYIAKGKGRFESKSCNSLEIEEGYFFMLFKEEWHNYRPCVHTGWDEYWIGFDGFTIDNRVNSGLLKSQEPIFKVGLRDEIVELYKKAILVARRQNPGYQQLLAGIVERLLGMAYSYNQNIKFENKAVHDKIIKAKIIMSEQFHMKIKPEDIAMQVGLGYSFFRQFFKKYTGLSPMKYILELRIRYSKELLTNTIMSSQEIAFSVGFDNPVNFCTMFKKRTGYTPIEYRLFTQGKTIQ